MIKNEQKGDSPEKKLNNNKKEELKMKNKKLTLITLSIVICIHLFISNAFAQLTEEEKRKSIETHLKFESDNPDDLLIYRGFVVNFNKKHKAPNWCIHKLTFDQIRPIPDREEAERLDRFRVDKNRRDKVRIKDQAKHKNYTNSGFDRGHMTPAGDFIWDQELKDETFFITNITPQTPDFNQTIWVDLEGKIRELVKKEEKDHFVITGAVYASIKAKNRGMSKRHIGIPSGFYKIVFDGNDRVYCWYIPHTFAYPDYRLPDYRVSVDEIEKLTGEDFFEKLSDDKEDVMESKIIEIK